MLRPFRKKTKQKPHIEIIPMVDVMFLLLVFYILSSLALTKQQGIDVQLPTSSTASAKNSTLHEDLAVSLDKEGNIYIQKRPVDEEHFSEVLQEESQHIQGGIAAVREGHVIIQCDKECRHEHFIKALDLLRKEGIQAYGIATESP